MTTQYLDGWGNPFPLPANTTVSFRMRSTNPVVTGWEIDAQAEILQDRSIVRYVWRAGDTDTPGKYYAEFVATLDDGRELVEPSGPTYYCIEVGARLKPDMAPIEQGGAL